MGKRVAFIRHGEAVHNPHLQASKKEKDLATKAELYAKGISFLDPELTEKGVGQAEGLRDRLEKEGREFDVVVVSPLRRTIQTAHIALAGRTTLFVVGLYSC
jgi:broad specificity phosphatase PhoE